MSYFKGDGNVGVGDLKVDIRAQIIARYKDWYHVLILMNDKFSSVLIAKKK